VSDLLDAQGRRVGAWLPGDDNRATRTLFAPLKIRLAVLSILASPLAANAQVSVNIQAS
jgi:hypothetical protein